MEKLTEKLNAMKISKTTKDCLVQIADQEEIQIQQVCRRLLSSAIKEYLSKIESKWQIIVKLSTFFRKRLCMSKISSTFAEELEEVLFLSIYIGS